jgi:hypothetical protein
VQRLRQQDGRAGVAARVALHERVAEGGGLVVLEQRRAVHHRVDAAKARDHLRGSSARVAASSSRSAANSAESPESAAQSATVCSAWASRVAVVHRHLPAASGQAQRNLAAQPVGLRQ